MSARGNSRPALAVINCSVLRKESEMPDATERSSWPARRSRSDPTRDAETSLTVDRGQGSGRTCCPSFALDRLSFLVQAGVARTKTTECQELPRCAHQTPNYSSALLASFRACGQPVILARRIRSAA